MQARASQAHDLRTALWANRSRLLRRARHMLRDESRAEDAVQDAMCDALRHAEEFRGEAQLGTWLYRVGVNAVLMGLRRERRQAERARRAALTVPDPSGWLVGAAERGPAEVLERRGEVELLRWAIAALPEHYRLIVLRCDVEEEDPQRVAAEAGLTLGGLRTRRLRAHRMLREAMSGACADAD